MSIYNEIYNFCKVRNKGNCYSNGDEMTPRVKFITELLDKEGIPYQIDSWEVEDRFSSFFDFNDEDYNEWRKSMKKRYGRYSRFFLDPFDEDETDTIELTKTEKPIEDWKLKLQDKTKNLQNDEKEKDIPKKIIPEKKKNILYNIILRGTSDKMVVAHHDIQNPNIDNANDNSCSVINAIAIKKLRPNIHVVILDGEELGQMGAERLGKQIKEGKFGSIKYVLNLELTGKGGKNFFVGNYSGPLTDKIVQMFDCPIVDTPVNDAVGIRRSGIDSTVINPLPVLPTGEVSRVKTRDGKYLDMNMLSNCHSSRDTVSTIDPKDMEEFVNEICLKILDEY